MSILFNDFVCKHVHKNAANNNMIRSKFGFFCDYEQYIYNKIFDNFFCRKYMKILAFQLALSVVHILFVLCQFLLSHLYQSISLSHTIFFLQSNLFKVIFEINSTLCFYCFSTNYFHVVCLLLLKECLLSLFIAYLNLMSL